MLLAELDANGWVVIIGAIGIIITQVLQMFLSYMRDKEKLTKLDENANKLDENTKITKESSHKADVISHQLNGGLDARIRAIVKEQTDPLVQAIQELRDSR